MIARYWAEYLGVQFPFARLDRNWYFAAQRALIDRILTRPAVSAAHAFVPGEPGETFGYAVAEPERRVLHWVYTKPDYRKRHVATRLLRYVFGDFDQPIVASIQTRALQHRAPAWNVRVDTYALGLGR